MKEIKFYTSKWTILGVLLPAAFFLSILWNDIYEILTSGSGLWLIYAVFFPFVAFIGLMTMHFRRPRIIISETGVRQSIFKSGEIKWEEIRKAVPSSYMYIFRSLTLDVDSLAPAAKSYGETPVTEDRIGVKTMHLFTIGVKMDVYRVAVLINMMVEAKPNERAEIIHNFHE